MGGLVNVSDFSQPEYVKTYTHWNRDVNATQNIRNIFLSINSAKNGCQRRLEEN
ncbi:hypothetical protein G9A89_008951 [Geosiphon pyriformis]|nr:hypothetical protein G9A89_008951 [Geosiphon pyriformis]